jgi:protein SCO1/2
MRSVVSVGGRKSDLRVFVACVLVLELGCRPPPEPPKPPPAAVAPAPATPSLPTFGALPELSFLDQEARPFTTAGMHGRVWIADFIYTTCMMACPRLTARMGLVQSRLKDEGPEIQLVSFSILPETDTPPVLKEYGRKYHQDPARWTFVTGKTDVLLNQLSDGFKTALAREPRLASGNDSNFVSLHGDLFVLIDATGTVRGYYKRDDADLDRLIADARQLAHGGAGYRL